MAWRKSLFLLSTFFMIGTTVDARSLNFEFSNNGVKTISSSCSDLRPTDYAHNMYGYTPVRFDQIRIPVTYSYQCTSRTESRDENGEIVSRLNCSTLYSRRYFAANGQWLDNVVSHECKSYDHAPKNVYPDENWHPPLLF